MNREKILRNFRSMVPIKDPRPKHRDGRQKHNDYQLLTPELVIYILENVRGTPRMEAKDMLKKMSQSLWYIRGSIHEGGSDPDAPMHFTIRIHRRGYHINCKMLKGGVPYVYEITSR